MIVFNGTQFAALRAETLAHEVDVLRAQGKELKIAALLFQEDAASQLYTRLKKEAAQRVGIAYEVHEFSLEENSDDLERTLATLAHDETVTGIIIQKPSRASWVTAKNIDYTQGEKEIRRAYTSWWRYLTSLISPKKDVDGLHPTTLAAVHEGTWREQRRVLPATATAIITIIEVAARELKISLEDKKSLRVAVIGRSDIVGLPVFYELITQGYDAVLLTRDDLEQRQRSGKQLLDMDIVISATGARHLVTGEMVKAGSVVIDVGEPQPDVEFESVSQKAAFVTPVPGGVGPMTVVCLLENCVTLAKSG